MRKKYFTRWGWIKYRVTDWWACRRHRCDYYRHYLAQGPAEMPHGTYHLQEEMAIDHFESCKHEARLVASDRSPFGQLQSCPTCAMYERRLRA